MKLSHSSVIHNRGVAMSQLLAALVVIVGCLTISANAAKAQSFADGFNRPDGAVDNGWVTWGAGGQIEGGQLKTFGTGGPGGGVGRQFSVTFPITFAFDFRTDDPGQGGWQIGFNGPSAAPPVCCLGSNPEFSLTQWGNQPLQYAYMTSTGQHYVILPATPGLQEYQSVFSHISGLINADLSAQVTITYPDTSHVTIATPAPPPEAIRSPQGSWFNLGNVSLPVGPHYFDNVTIAPPSPGEQIGMLLTSTLLTNLSANIQNQLDAKLNAALGVLDAANNNSVTVAVNQLQAFVNAVKADLQGGKLTCAQATPLVDTVQSIVAALGQPPLSVSLACQ